MERSSTHELNIVMALTKCSLCSFTNSRESFWQDRIEIFTGCESILKGCGEACKLGIAQSRYFWLEGIYFGSDLLEISNSAAFACA
jgi:hypothetical protein